MSSRYVRYAVILSRLPGNSASKLLTCNDDEFHVRLNILLYIHMYTHVQQHQHMLFNYGKPDNATALNRCLALCAFWTLHFVHIQPAFHVLLSLVYQLLSLV